VLAIKLIKRSNSTIGLETLKITKSKGIPDETKRAPVKSSNMFVQNVLRYPNIPSIPKTDEMLKTLEPRMSPTLIPGSP
jgi:hypothetical protein